MYNWFIEVILKYIGQVYRECLGSPVCLLDCQLRDAVLDGDQERSMSHFSIPLLSHKATKYYRP